MLSAAEGDRRGSSSVEVLQRLERGDEPFAAGMRARAPQCFDHHLGGGVGMRLERDRALGQTVADQEAA